MADFGTLVFGAALADNLALDLLLGICPVVAVSRRLQTAAGFALAALAVLPVIAALSAALVQHLLVPLGLGHLRLVVLVLAATLLTEAPARWLGRRRPDLYERFGVFLPLLTANCLALGVALLVSGRSEGVWAAFFHGLGLAGGVALVVVMLACLRERLAGAPLPAPFRDLPATFLALGLMSLGFSGLEGVGG